MHLPKLALNIAITIVVLLALVAVAGVGYTWYSGQHTAASQSSANAVLEPKPIPTIQPTIPSATAKVGAAIEMLTSPIVPGSEASITVKTKAFSTCSISVVYDKTPSKDPRLVSQTADDFGIVNWSWDVGPTVPLGKWPVKVTCVQGKLSGAVQGDQYVVKQLPAN